MKGRVRVYNTLYSGVSRLSSLNHQLKFLIKLFFDITNEGGLCMFSGDTDAVVPISSTRYSIDALKLPTRTNWYPWYYNGRVSLNINALFLCFLHCYLMCKLESF